MIFCSAQGIVQQKTLKGIYCCRKNRAAIFLVPPRWKKVYLYRLENFAFNTEANAKSRTQFATKIDNQGNANLYVRVFFFLAIFYGQIEYLKFSTV